MDGSGDKSFSMSPVSSETVSEEEYVSPSKLLQEFAEISTIAKAWTFAARNGKGSKAMFEIGQPNFKDNVNRKFILSSHIIKEKDDFVSLEWAPFPVEMKGVSTILPSPSGLKLLVIRNSINDSPTCFEIWGSSQMEKEFQVPSSVHGSVYADGWFEGISWNCDETLIAYVAEEPVPPRPMFTAFGYKMGDGKEKDIGCWKGQGQWEQDWGETYEGKRQPALFVININSGEVRPVQGIPESISAGQVVWTPSTELSHEYLVFVGWSSSETRKFGIKYCYNRPCSLYATTAPFPKSEASNSRNNASEDVSIVNLTQTISSAFFPRFSPDGKFLVFLSARTAVDSGSHWATNSLHRIEWPAPADGKLLPSTKIVDVVPVVMCSEEGCFPGLYCTKIMSNPWLSDGATLILSTDWRSTEAIISVNVMSGDVSRISPADSNSYWDALALDGDNIIAVCSSPVDVPEIRCGLLAPKSSKWTWLDVANPISRYSDKVQGWLSSRQFRVLKIPVKDDSENLSKGAREPYEAISVSSKSLSDVCEPLIVVLHGGPHSVSSSSFSKSLAFLSSLGYNLLIVNYRGSLGFGEEALQSLPGKVGSQDVNDVLAAIDHIIDMGLAKPSKIAVMGLSHGGFLTTHLIGQAPDKFAAAVAMNPVCNLALMVGTTDIPDWCYVITCGRQGKSIFTEAPSAEHLALFLNKSPISHVNKVKAPTLFLLGAKDLRVPVSNGLHYARALKEKGGVVKVIVFPDEVHGLKRPQSNLESFLNIGVWFNKYCK